MDVLAALAGGQANREIARNLLISEETVKTHVFSILTKLGLADRTRPPSTPCGTASPAAGSRLPHQLLSSLPYKRVRTMVASGY